MSDVHKENKRYYFFATFIFSLIILFTYSVYVGHLKEGFHMDEMYSYGLSNSVDYTFPSRNNEWVNSNYFLNYVSVSPDERFAFGSVINNQINDVHPPLYYLMLHTVASFFPDIFSKWIGIGINIGLYLGIYILLVVFINKIIKNKWIALASGLFWALSIGAASSIVFIRMYMLLTIISLMLLYIVSNIMNKEEVRIHDYLYLILTLVAGSLTQYYFFVYSFFVIAVACTMLFMHREWLKSIKLGLFSLLGIGISYLLFPTMIHHIFIGNRGEEAFDNIVSQTEFNFFELVSRDLFGGFLWLIGIIILVWYLLSAVFFKQKLKWSFMSEKNNVFSYFIMSVIPSGCYLLVVQRIAPYHSERYILNIYPSIVIGFTLLVYYLININLKRKNTRILTLIMVSLFIIINAIGWSTQSINYLYQGDTKEIYQPLKEYEDVDSFVISSAFWKTNGMIDVYLELDDIYRMHSTDGMFPTLPEDERLYSNDSLLLFLDSDFNEEENINKIISKYNFNSYEHVITHDQSVVYYLE